MINLYVTATYASDRNNARNNSGNKGTRPGAPITDIRRTRDRVSHIKGRLVKGVGTRRLRPVVALTRCTRGAFLSGCSGRRSCVVAPSPCCPVEGLVHALEGYTRNSITLLTSGQTVCSVCALASCCKR